MGRFFSFYCDKLSETPKVSVFYHGLRVSERLEHFAATIEKFWRGYFDLDDIK